MTVAWQKRGLLISPSPVRDWMSTHAMLPVPQALGKVTRVYVTGRGPEGRGAIGWCDVDLPRATVVDTSDDPILSAGPLGAFDDSGVSGSALVEQGGRQYLFYTGWTRGVTVPFYVFLGLAVSADGGATFRRVSRAPILERSDLDPFLTGHPAVLVENDIWRMWYVSCSEWRVVDGSPRHYYHVRYAESSDGILWKRTGRVCIDYVSDEEYAIARPWVMKGADGKYRMWFSRRGKRYRIGYAESIDGLVWERMDRDVGIDVSPEGWDSASIEYPAVIAVGDREFMLYNGNEYGRTGIGLAERRRESSR